MSYNGEIECPFCGFKNESFKVLKEWTHGLHFVERRQCSKCESIFRFYYGEKMDGTPFNYTIAQQ